MLPGSTATTRGGFRVRQTFLLRRPINFNKEASMKRRGGYTFDRIHPVKFRVSPAMLETLQKMSEAKGMCMAWVVRELVKKGLESKGAS